MTDLPTREYQPDADALDYNIEAEAHVPPAHESLLRAALRCLSAERADEHSHAAAEAEYCEEQLALAARDLTRAVDSLPTDRRPVGW